MVSGKAGLDTKNAYDGTIFWTYSGDTDSIEVLTTSSAAGQEVDLFQFKKPGKVTARAASGADISLYADLQFTAVAQGIESITLEGGDQILEITVTVTGQRHRHSSSGSGSSGSYTGSRNAKDRWILGWLLDQGRWYYLASGTGEMQTGLITESGHQYYLSPEDGHMLTGPVQTPGSAEIMLYKFLIIFCEPNCVLLRLINDGTNRR